MQSKYQLIFNENTPRRKAFQTVSESFDKITIPGFTEKLLLFFR